MKSEYTSTRGEVREFTVPIDGKTYTLRPPKKTKAMLGMMAPADPNDPMDGVLTGPKAMLAWFVAALNSDHLKTKRKPGHGKTYVEGCQACEVLDRLDDDEDPLEIETIFAVANDIMGEMGERPTSSSNA